MAVSANTCYEVVNISWLKALVSDSVQKSDGTTASVSEVSGTTYCPTYKQLTDGTFIPYRSESSDGPASDTDGITVNKKCYSTGENYADNQLVNKHDVAVCNTRLKTFTIDIADASTNISGCSGGTKNLSFTRTFTRNTWDMLSCSTQTASSHSSTDVDDARDSLVTWSTNVGSISNKKLTVGKNTPSTSGGSASRTITVTGSSTFRGTTSTPTASVTQNGVSGSVENWYTGETSQSDYKIVPSQSTFPCSGGSFTVTASHVYKTRQYKHWVDECGVAYNSAGFTGYSDSTASTTKTDETYSGSFSDITLTSTGNITSSFTHTWSSTNYSSTTVTQKCAVRPTDCASETGTSVQQTATVECAGGDVTFSDVSVPVTSRTINQYNECVSSTTTTTRSTTVTVPCYTGSTAHDITGTQNNISYKITQNAGDCTCTQKTEYTYGTGSVTSAVTCAGGNIELEATNIPYTAVTDNGDGTSATTYGDTAGTATVTIAQCTDTAGCTTSPTDPVTASPHGKFTYTVTQTGCSPTCTTASCTAYKVGAATCSAIAATATTATVSWPYSAYTVTTSSTCDVTSTYSSSGTTTKDVSVAQNTSCTSVTRSGSFTWTDHKALTNTPSCGGDITVSWSLTQNGKVATCADLTVSAGDAGAASGGSFTLGSYGGSCLNGVSASTTATWISNLKVNSDKTISGAVGTNTSTSERTTTIKVTATECTSGKTFTYKQNGTEVTCPTQSNIINTNTTIAGTGGTQVAVMQILKDSTYTAYTITATSTSSSYVSNVNQGAELHDNWYVVLADVTANPNTSDRSVYFDVVVEGPTLGTGCTYNNVKVTQKEGCPTGFLTGFTGTIGKDGGYCVALGRFKNNMTNYTTAITVTVSDGTTMGICSTASTWSDDSSWNLVQINVPANPNTTTRTITIECALTKGSNTCTESITITQNPADSCTCNDLTFKGVESDCPVMVSLYNDYGNVIYLEDIGLKVDGAWKYEQVDQDDGEIHWQKERVVAVLDYSTSDTNKTIQNASATIGQDSVNPGVEYCQMACSPTTINPGALIRLTWDGDWSGSHHSCEDPGDGKIKVKVDLNDGTTSPAIHFVNSSNTQLLGVVRYTTDTETTGTWKVASGTCTKMRLVEMGGNYTRVSVTIQKSSQAPITLIENGTLPSTSGSDLSLDRSFKIEDYYDSSTCTITITFR